MEDILVLSHHRKKAIKRCRFKAYIHYDLRKRKVETDINLIFGTAIHNTLEVYYRHKRDVELDNLLDVFKLSMMIETDSHLLQTDFDTWTKFGINIVTQYYNQTKHKEKFNILETERSFFLSVSDEGKILSDSREVHKDAFFILAGKVDLTIGQGSDIFFVDHKTTVFNLEKFIEHFRLDEQLLDYSIYGKWKYGNSFKGTVANGINKRSNSNDPLIFREWLTYSDEEIDNALLSYLDTAQEHYILRQVPHLLQQRVQDFDCNRCADLDVSIAKRRGEDWKKLIELFYEDIHSFDWEEDIDDTTK